VGFGGGGLPSSVHVFVCVCVCRVHVHVLAPELWSGWVALQQLEKKEEKNPLHQQFLSCDQLAWISPPPSPQKVKITSFFLHLHLFHLLFHSTGSTFSFSFSFSLPPRLFSWAPVMSHLRDNWINSIQKRDKAHEHQDGEAPFKMLQEDWASANVQEKEENKAT